ncbi:MAG: hypothetical protein EAZ08_04060 [Cytophagales bacterium]|nr:MAG: hypothetical protein EAZ08_04060 [Cytophagales bacterium]
MKKTIFLFITSCSLLFSFQIFEKQIIDIGKIITQLADFYQKYPTEKVYLHLDKPYYAAGEKVWFKAYLQNEKSDTIDMSKILYVELISPYQYVSQHLQLYVNSLATFGDITLPDTLSEGVYRLRAYTNYMRNFGEDYFFEKQIQIFNPRNKANIQKNTIQKSNEIDLQFFPEGGDLVYSLRSTIGFKAINAQGLGVEISGEVYDSEGIKSATFKSNQLGMGSFKLAPSLNRAYKAKIKLADGKELTYDLPKAQQNGFVINLENLPDNRLRLRVLANRNGLEGKEKDLFIIAQKDGQVLYSVQDTTDKPAFLADISKQIFPTGITHFTLFDGNGVPRAERMIFVNQQDFLTVSIGKAKESYKPREKINLSVFVADNLGGNVATDFSVAVTDIDIVLPLEREDNILTNLLLTSELRGNIEQPAFYFQNTAEAAKALDDLMLTQGWRRFQWKNLINNNLTPFAYQMENSMSISGIAKGALGVPFRNADVKIFTVNNMPFIGKTDEKGRFEISGLNFLDSVDVMVQIENEKKDKASKVEIAERTFAEVNKIQHNFLSNPDLVPYITQSQRAIQAERAFRAEKDVRLLKEVTVNSTKIIGEDSVHRHLKIYRVADATVSGARLTKLATGRSNVLSALQGVAGVRVLVNPSGEPTITIGGGLGSLGASTPLVLFDGMPVTIDFFGGISAEEIDHIDVLKYVSAAIYGTRGANGVIAVYSKKNPKRTSKKADVIYQKMMGYYLGKEFYSPNYETMSKEEKIRPDLRSTIYWNPQVFTDGEGTANLSFFAADTPAKYRVVIEGKSWGGKLGRKEVVIEVKK